MPATARVETWRAMVEDRQAPRAPSDGGGRVVEVEGPEQIGAGESGRWSMGFEVGPAGIAVGGSVVFQAPPFWGWDSPQVRHPEGAGFTEVRTEAEGVRLEVATVDQQMLRIAVAGRALRGGERVWVTYGAGAAGARADRFAERESELWFAVDGDGDGVRKLIAEPVRVRVVAGPARRLLVTVPTVAHPGESVPLRVAVLDARGNAFGPWAGRLTIEAPDGLGAPQHLVIPPDADGLARVAITPTQPGVHVARVSSEDGLIGTSNPMVVRAGAPKILWADLQIHTGRSDGTGVPDDVYRYARDVAGLDVAAVTDHDHWGMRFMDDTPWLWDEARQVAGRFDDPGSFVALVGYEWTHWLYGHRHVLWFEDESVLYSAMDPRTDTPSKLWAALRGRRAITVAHHSAGGPVAVDWSFAPDPVLEPVTEIVSVHGQSESPTAPGVIADAVAGNFVVDQLRSGARLGLIGSTDGHDGHPGMAHLAAGSGGLAALITDDRTRGGVYEALMARRVYATNGVRGLLRFEVDGVQMGGTVEVAEAPVVAVIRVVGTAPVARIEVVGRQREEVLMSGSDRIVLHERFEIPAPQPGDFAYVRVVQQDGGVLWSSPVWFEAQKEK